MSDTEKTNEQKPERKDVCIEVPTVKVEIVTRI